jgi:uncharacterized protein (TIGR03435 family)
MMRTMPVRGDRYEVRFATMVDLIHLAYGIDRENVLGGPSWLEMDRFDVLAKMPPAATTETVRLMLQALLKERFDLVVHKGTRPIPAYALIAGKHPALKEADASEESGCKRDSDNGLAGGPDTRPAAKGAKLGTAHVNSVLHYACRKVTMAAFAEALPAMMGPLGTRPVFDRTGLSGEWTFSLSYSLPSMDPLVDPYAERASIFSALEKQLGLKLDKREVAVSGIVVDSVNERPRDNPGSLAETLPAVPQAAAFEFAVIKVANPDAGPAGVQIQPGGRITIRRQTMGSLVSRAFDLTDRKQLVGLPAWADAEQYDIIAKAPTDGASPPIRYIDETGPMMRTLLVDRFRMTYHQEERPIAAYSLVSVSPRLKKSDPSVRASCTTLPAPGSAPPRSLELTCHNVTMAQFADQLWYKVAELSLPILDSTGIAGGWDFSLTYSPIAAVAASPDRGLEENTASASETSGALTLFESVRKSLGLRLEKYSRAMPVVVIDNLQRKATDN